MKIVKKAYFSLLEVIIALGLLSILLTAVFGLYHDLEVVHTQLEQTRAKNFQRLHAQNRIKKILSQISRGNKKQFLIGSKEVFFFTTYDGSDEILGSNLLFMFNNGVNAVPHFSQDVLARLFVDKKHRLCLAIWPSPDFWVKLGKSIPESPIHKEILLENVSSMSFEFYFPPSIEDAVKTKDVQIGRDVIDPDAGWSKEWKLGYQQLPDLVKIILKVEGEELIFVSPVNNFKKPILIKI